MVTLRLTCQKAGRMPRGKEVKFLRRLNNLGSGQLIPGYLSSSRDLLKRLSALDAASEDYLRKIFDAVVDDIRNRFDGVPIAVYLDLDEAHRRWFGTGFGEFEDWKRRCAAEGRKRMRIDRIVQFGGMNGGYATTPQWVEFGIKDESEGKKAAEPTGAPIRKAGRPKVVKEKRLRPIKVGLEPRLKAWLEDTARRDRISIGAVVREASQAFVDNGLDLQSVSADGQVKGLVPLTVHLDAEQRALIEARRKDMNLSLSALLRLALLLFMERTSRNAPARQFIET